jgi:hypothetical protein
MLPWAAETNRPGAWGMTMHQRRMGIGQGPWIVATAALALIGTVRAEDKGDRAQPLPHRVFAASRFSMDEILARPYGPDVPMGCVGARVWASSPQGWAFGHDVHWLYLTNLEAFDLEIRDAAGPLQPRRATYYPSHVHLEGAVHRVAASASFTSPGDDVQNPLSRPFRPEKRWTCWSSGSRWDWYAIDFGTLRKLRGLTVFFFDDTPRGGCRPPQGFGVERWDGRDWRSVEMTRRRPERPGPGENTVDFDPIETEKIRLSFHNAGDSFYTGLYGLEPLATGDDRPASGSPLEVTADKFITPDDVLVSVVRVHNPTDRPQKIAVNPSLGWPAERLAETIQHVSDSIVVVTRTDVAEPVVLREPHAVQADGLQRLHGHDMALRFRLSYADVSDDLPGDLMRRGVLTPSLLEPGKTKVFRAALELKRPEETTVLDGILTTPSFGEVIPPERRASRDPLADQIRRYQGWFDDNLAYFDCSDPWVRKMYYHRAYNLRKNMLDPRLGRMQWPTQSEGRWRSPWYPNVISYGAAHQVREARWLRDPKYWQGHLRTWAENQKPDGVYPSHITPSGPSGGQYTDWITSTAWDGSLVHPDKDFLAATVEKLAANVRGWQKAYDPDGDGLLLVDDHWWTGMEWQPSFFFDSDYKTAPKDHGRPAKPVRLERVDLTAYNYGNAAAVARIYRLLGRPEKAKEFEDLAGKIAQAVAARMWDPEGRFFDSLRFEDKARIPVKEVVGVYPFYFGMLPRGQGYEGAWASILDPEQFWTAWPVASASKQCPAYAQDGWPTEPGRGTACMWNGPTWPHANSIVLTAMARTLRADRDLGRASSPLTAEHLWTLFSSFTHAQYRDQDLTYPWTGEYYNGETARWKTAERDYNHSTWLDVLIPEILGLVPRADDVLEIDPLVPEGKLSHFLLDGQHYRGHDVTLAWDAPGGDDHYGDGREALDVYLDGKRVASAEGLTRLLIDLKDGRPLARDPAAAR